MTYVAPHDDRVESVLPLIAIGDKVMDQSTFDMEKSKINLEHDKRRYACMKKASEWRTNTLRVLTSKREKEKRYEALVAQAKSLNLQKESVLINGDNTQWTKPPDLDGIADKIPGGGTFIAVRDLEVVETVLCCIPSTSKQMKIVYSKKIANKIIKYAMIATGPNGKLVARSLSADGKLRWS